MYLLRGELRRACGLAEQLLRLAQRTHDPAPLLLAESTQGQTWFTMGELLLASEHLKMAISPYDLESRNQLARRAVIADAGVPARSYAARTLWFLGYPDQALKRINAVRALAQTLSHPFSLAFAEYFVAELRQLRREIHAVEENAEDTIALSIEHGLTDWLAWATTLRGWAMAAQGRYEEGIVQMEQGLASSCAAGAELLRPYFLCLLAETYKEMGRLDGGMNALTEALAAADEHEIRYYEAEMYRLKGELLLRRQAERSGVEQTSPGVTLLIIDSNTAEAKNCFERAIEIARKQSAKSLELRSTISLARLLAKAGRGDEARAMLAEIYNWFTEGFDTADLKDAKALLEQLQAPPVLGEQR